MQRNDSSTLSLFHSFTPACVAALLVLLTAAPAFAQGTEVVQHQRVPYMELLVTFVLFAGAVFAVCRSSRRN